MTFPSAPSSLSSVRCASAAVGLCCFPEERSLPFSLLRPPALSRTWRLSALRVAFCLLSFTLFARSSGAASTLRSSSERFTRIVVHTCAALLASSSVLKLVVWLPPGSHWHKCGCVSTERPEQSRKLAVAEWNVHLPRLAHLRAALPPFPAPLRPRSSFDQSSRAAWPKPGLLSDL